MSKKKTIHQIHTTLQQKEGGKDQESQNDMILPKESISLCEEQFNSQSHPKRKVGYKKKGNCLASTYKTVEQHMKLLLNISLKQKIVLERLIDMEEYQQKICYIFETEQLIRELKSQKMSKQREKKCFKLVDELQQKFNSQFPSQYINQDAIMDQSGYIIFNQETPNQ